MFYPLPTLAFHPSLSCSKYQLGSNLPTGARRVFVSSLPPPSLHQDQRGRPHCYRSLFGSVLLISSDFQKSDRDYTPVPIPNDTRPTTSSYPLDHLPLLLTHLTVRGHSFGHPLNNLPNSLLELDVRLSCN